jgi:hypothetical protein
MSTAPLRLRIVRAIFPASLLLLATMATVGLATPASATCTVGGLLCIFSDPETGCVYGSLGTSGGAEFDTCNGACQDPETCNPGCNLPACNFGPCDLDPNPCEDAVIDQDYAGSSCDMRYDGVADHDARGYTTADGRDAVCIELTTFIDYLYEPVDRPDGSPELVVLVDSATLRFTSGDHADLTFLQARIQGEGIPPVSTCPLLNLNLGSAQTSCTFQANSLTLTQDHDAQDTPIASQWNARLVTYHNGNQLSDVGFLRWVEF